MEKSRGIILALAIAAAILAAAPPCPAAEKNNNKDDQGIFAEDERGEERPGRGRGRDELTEDEINRIMVDFKKRNPEKAKELSDLRKKDPEKFREELRKHATEELEKLIDERSQKWRQERQAAFLEWLEKNFHDESRELARLKVADPNVYNKKYDLVSRKYYRIFEVSRRNPELAEVLLEDVKLQKRQDELVAKIKTTKNQEQNKKLTSDLEEVVALRYDVILRRRQMAYEWLLKRIEDLRNQLRDSHNEIIKYQDPKTKEENIKQRTKDLLEEKKRFWD
ncbi:MAG: hypothetical protein A2Z25_19930 [Planctomycetes bacterium RBG_16_55_9]|nr:MAG: hypothetical protein A2Z25_19930 [Planctomycetes bacterium RBG_16_55_9]